jgi:hypothetical protein
MSDSAERACDRCVLDNPVFTRLGLARFRRAESDGAPAMVVAFGDSFAALPLRSLQREFGIDDASADGRMLGLIAESLDFVAGLTIGDKLPSEVLSGSASWQPDARHQQIAAARLRMQLLAWIDPAMATAEAAQPSSLDRLETDPNLRATVQRAFVQAAKALDLPGPQEVMQLVADTANELSYIEALRETFLRRVQSMVAQLDRLTTGNLNVDRQTALTRIRGLAHLALNQITGRFTEVEMQTSEVLATLRHAERHRSFIRLHRDWLYRSSRAWEPILAEWDGVAPGLDEILWTRLNRTYQFLAPRFMPVQEWFAMGTPATARKKRSPENIMVW